MPDFSIIVQDPTIRALVQDGVLERAFHDALFPKLLFRGEVAPQKWPGQIGDTLTFSAPGLLTPSMAPLTPGTDPTPGSWSAEQWSTTIQQYAGTIDTNMPTSIVAIANLFLRNCQQLGLQAGQSLNRLTRNQMFNAAMSGQTVATAAAGGGSSASLPVARLNGFTRARNPSLQSGSQVQYAPVSSNNPLAITISGTTAASVIGYTPVNTGDEIGPGTLTLAVAKDWSSRDSVVSFDSSQQVYIGGGTRVDDITTSDTLSLTAIRTMISQFWTNNVPENPDGFYHCHLDPMFQAQVFNDTEFQRLLTSLPDHYMYRQFALGQLLQTVFFRNSENPLPTTVQGGGTSFATETYTPNDAFGGELWNPSNLAISRALFSGQGGIYEYWLDPTDLLTEAGLTGKVGEPRITNNGIEVMTERIQLILRAPLNRLQDMVSATWRFMGNWAVRTDGATGVPARYKRFGCILGAI